MTDEKMIEEMAKDINNAWAIKNNGDIFAINEKLNKNDIAMLAHQLVLGNYRKLPENAVVVMPDKLDEYQKAELKIITDQVRKETVREILKKGNEYLMQSTDKACAFACFLGIMEYDYGVEIEE